jgi:hypothetical protein
MNTISYDSFKNILSFLQPLELCKLRYTNHEYHRVTDQYLQAHYQTIVLDSYVCPSCGKYYQGNENEINHSYFYDIPYGDEREEMHRLHSMSNVYSYYTSVKRVQLFCDDCDGNEIDINFNDYTSYSSIVKKKLLPYRGKRDYELHLFGRGTNYPWIVLTYHDINNHVLWNEVRSFITNMPLHMYINN